ncbi:hypothetical protein [Syntrophus gentianae]|uniref:hypothetical protein n=1 Tax=Syntrophus gentianae TaxID=43775 RepID=UPI00158745B2|nr:hypothetical protein [Syntrophus gentianae]
MKGVRKEAMVVTTRATVWLDAGEGESDGKEFKTLPAGAGIVFSGSRNEEMKKL